METGLVVKFKWKLRKHQTGSSSVETPSETTRQSSSAAAYRKRVKESKPEKYNELKAKERTRWHARKRLVDELSAKAQEDQRKVWKRQKATQRAKKSGSLVQQPRKKLKDMTPEEKREYWKEQKRMKRKSATYQKKVREKINDRERKKKERSKNSIDSPPSSVSRSTVYRQSKRLRLRIPDSPRAYVNIVEKMITTATPKKAAEFQCRQLGVRKRLLTASESSVETSLKSSISESKASTSGKNRYNYYQCATLASHGGLTYRKAKAMGVSFHVYSKIKHGPISTKKKRRDRFSLKKQEEVKDFWYTSSRQYPCKKRVRKNKSMFIVESSYTEMYKRFKKSHPNTKIGFIKFLQLKPSNVRKLKAQERSVCCCNKCENAKWMLKSLNQACQGQSVPESRLDSIQDLSDLMFCEYDPQAFPSPSCLEAECQVCGSGKVRTHYNPLLNKADKDEIEYNAWEIVREEKDVRDGRGGTKKKIVSSTKLVTHKTVISDLISKVVQTAETLSLHLFRARWQLKEFGNAKKHMKPKSAVMVIDFAQNYVCSFQDESQSSHWSQTQVTIHPAVAYVNNSDEEGSHTHLESMVFISADLKHDAAAVKVFTQKAHHHLHTKYDVNKIIQFSDCCAGQYRCRQSFDHIANTTDVKLERHYFEASHGKSAADGLSAVLKYGATKAVTHRKSIIRNAQEFFTFCLDNLQEVGSGPFASQQHKEHSSRKFFYVESIQRQKVVPPPKSIKGTMTIHAVRSLGDPKVLLTRGLSCFCTACRHASGSCVNASYVKPWTIQKMQPGTPRNTNTATSEHDDAADDQISTVTSQADEDDQPSTCTNISNGSWVAVIYDDKWFPGVVENVRTTVDDTQVMYKVNFMHPSGRKNRFVWPQPKDTDELPKAEILTVIGDAPKPVSRRHLTFPETTFQDKVFNRVVPHK